MMDRENLLVCSVLEHHLSEWGRPDLAAVYDWFSPHSIKFMPPVPTHSFPHQFDHLDGPTPSLPLQGSSFTRQKGSLSIDNRKVHPQPGPFKAFLGKSKRSPQNMRNLSSSKRPTADDGNDSLTDGLPNLLPGDMDYASLHPRAHYRFAAGRVLPKPWMAALYR